MKIHLATTTALTLATMILLAAIGSSTPLTPDQPGAASQVRIGPSHVEAELALGVVFQDASPARIFIGVGAWHLDAPAGVASPAHAWRTVDHARLLSTGGRAVVASTHASMEDAQSDTNASTWAMTSFATTHWAWGIEVPEDAEWARVTSGDTVALMGLSDGRILLMTPEGAWRPAPTDEAARVRFDAPRILVEDECLPTAECPPFPW